jgi:hypothetical protein
MPKAGVRVVQNWKNVRLTGEIKGTQKVHQLLHPVRTYPASCYSPIMGVLDDDKIVAAAMIYEPFETKIEARMNYGHSAKAGWSMQYDLWTERHKRVNKRNVLPPPMSLDPGQTLELTIALTVAPATKWVTAYRPYRDFFRATYGEVRYKDKAPEPVFCRSLGITPKITEENPRGYFAWSSGDGKGRIDQKGWTGFHERVMDTVYELGFRRMMLKQVSGSYRKHRGTNMVFEITSAWSDTMNATAGEIEKLRKEGMDIGLWWGRASTVSMGYDSGRRHAFDPDTPDDWTRTYKELDKAYRLGFRMIGLDDINRSVIPNDWHPSSQVMFETWFPAMYERYPEMVWVIEPAACDFLHLWGGSYFFTRDIGGPNEFAPYLSPGSHSYAVMKRRYGPTGQDVVNKTIRWGYIPYIYNDGFKFTIDRELMKKHFPEFKP